MQGILIDLSYPSNLNSQKYKGKDNAIDYCVKNNLDYEIIWNKGYDETLETLAKKHKQIPMPFGVGRYVGQKL